MDIVSSVFVSQGLFQFFHSPGTVLLNLILQLFTDLPVILLFANIKNKLRPYPKRRVERPAAKERFPKISL
jgi:hypothetical protein